MRGGACIYFDKYNISILSSAHQMPKPAVIMTACSHIFIKFIFSFFPANQMQMHKPKNIKLVHLSFIVYCIWMEPYPHHQQLPNHNSETPLKLIRTDMDVNFNHCIV
jgi:hypothetical protein